jgi:hypothetical protein
MKQPAPKQKAPRYPRWKKMLWAGIGAATMSALVSVYDFTEGVRLKSGEFPRCTSPWFLEEVKARIKGRGYTLSEFIPGQQLAPGRCKGTVMSEGSPVEITYWLEWTEDTKYRIQWKY